jgi:hypothetical protein
MKYNLLQELIEVPSGPEKHMLSLVPFVFDLLVMLKIFICKLLSTS